MDTGLKALEAARDQQQQDFVPALRLRSRVRRDSRLCEDVGHARGDTGVLQEPGGD